MTTKCYLMKLQTALAVLFLLVLTGCIKSIANEELAPQHRYDRKAVGTSAYALLADERYKTLKVEIQYMKGFEPELSALATFREFLEKYLSKPDGIIIETKEIERAAKDTLTIEDITQIEKENRTEYTTDSTIAVHVLYTSGTFKKNNILGWAYGNTSMVLFGKTIKDNSNKIGKPKRSKLEATVLMHEMGHLMGLVNVGTKHQSDHFDEEHGKHCTNKKCLMYYMTEVNDPYDYLINTKMAKLDKACEDDLRANGSKLLQKH